MNRLLRSVEFFLSGPLVSKFILSLIIMISFMFLHHLFKKGIRYKSWNLESQRKASVVSRNILIIIFLICIYIIWSAGIKNMAISFVAVGAAFVIATKELITCITGGVVRLFSSVSIGSKISIGGLNGHVIDMSLLTTTIMELGELGQTTGDRISFPNSDYLSKSVKVKIWSGNYELRNIPVVLPLNVNAVKNKELLLEIALKQCALVIAPAQLEIKEIESDIFYDMPSANPRILISWTEKDCITLMLRIPVPVGNGLKYEQAILNEFLSVADLTVVK